MASQYVKLPVDGGGGGGGGGTTVAGKIFISSQSGFDSTPAQVQFTSTNAEFDTGGVIGTNALIATEAGYYTCAGSAYSPTNTSFIILYYSINSGPLISFAPTVSGTPNYFAASGGTFQLSLSQGDQVKFHIFAPQGQANNILFSMIKA